MSSRPFNDDDYTGYDPRLASQRFESYSNFNDDANSVPDSPPLFNNHSYGTGDDVIVSQSMPETHSPASILPSPEDMESEEGAALRVWRRQNATRLEEKEKKEKEMLEQIIKEAEEYKIEFYKKRVTVTENNKVSNREKEKILLENREKFHAEAEKNYWKAISELIPHEVPVIEKRGKKDKERKPSIVVIQGPKPGKPTDLSRMRQILVKLKHNPPSHMKPKLPPSAEAKKDAKTGTPAASSPSGAGPSAPPKTASATPPKAVAAASELELSIHLTSD